MRGRAAGESRGRDAGGEKALPEAHRGGHHQSRFQERERRLEGRGDQRVLPPPKALTPFSGHGMVRPDWPELGAGREDLS